LRQNHARLRAGDDAAKAGWFDIEKLPDNLAFDHEKIISLAADRLKRRRIYRINTAKQ
jgi:8-oxo-dGTP diphosphatase